MALFTVERTTPLPAATAWARLTDWPRHGARVPLTRVRKRTAGPCGPGAVVVARTALGRLGFDDPMEIVRWCPPAGGAAGRCRLEKRGRVVTGWAEFEVTPVGDGTRVVWREDAGVRGVPALFDPLTARMAGWVFGRVVDHVLTG